MVGGRADGWLEFVDHQHRNIVSKLSRPPFLCYRYLCPNFADAEISRFPRCRTDGSHGKMPREGDDDEDEEEGSIVLVRWSRLVKYIYIWWSPQVVQSLSSSVTTSDVSCTLTLVSTSIHDSLPTTLSRWLSHSSSQT